MNHVEMVLYTANGSNSSQRVEWVLNWKNVSYRRIEVTSELRASRYKAINALGYVPALEVGGDIFSESMAIVEYLEERFPHPCLFGHSLSEKTHIRRICEYVNASIHTPQNRSVLAFLRPELSDIEKRQLRAEWVAKSLETLKPQLCQQSSYAIGECFSLADIFVASIFKKSLQHGAVGDEFYHAHLSYLRAQPEVQRCEPHTMKKGPI